MEIKDISGLGQPLSKLIEVVSAGVGRIYEPSHIRRMADAKAYEVKQVGHAATEAELGRQLLMNPLNKPGQTIIDVTSHELLQRTGQRLLWQEIERQKNIDQIVAKSVQSLPTGSVSDEPVDKGWIARFFTMAAEVSEPEMQDLWGKVLGGEVVSPGRFGARSLEVLKNLNQNEAMLFKKTCSLVTGNNEFVLKIPTSTNSQPFQMYDEDAFTELGLPFQSVMLLVDAGLMFPETNTSRIISLKNGPWQYVNNGRRFKASAVDDNTKELRLGALEFTVAGQQLGTLIHDSFNEAYFDLLAERYLIQGVKFEPLT